jgi:hypothetical protein
MPTLDEMELSSEFEFRRSKAMPSLLNDTKELELLIVLWDPQSHNESSTGEN